MLIFELKIYFLEYMDEMCMIKFMQVLVFVLKLQLILFYNLYFFY